MNRDDIIRMAREAGIFVANNVSMVVVVKDQIERFSNMVEAAAVKAEREACAVACDSVYYQNIGPGFGEVRQGIAECAAAIRARGTP